MSTKEQPLYTFSETEDRGTQTDVILIDNELAELAGEDIILP